MKKLKYLVMLLAILIPINVFAFSLNEKPGIVRTKEGIDFYSDGESYSAYVNFETTELNLIIEPEDGYTLDGSTRIILNDDVTIFNIKIISPDSGIDEAPPYSEVIPFYVYKSNGGESASLLEDLKVVGYKLKFNKEKFDYKVVVPSNINEVYIDAEALGNITTVSGAGVVELTGKKTKVEVKVFDIVTGGSTYTITITKRNYTLIYIIVFIVILLIILGVLYYLFKRYQDKTAVVDKDILNKGVKDLDIDINKYIKNKEENVDDISNSENLEKGILDLAQENNK